MAEGNKGMKIKIFLCLLAVFSGFLLSSSNNAASANISFKVAAVEFNPQFMQFDTNLAKIATVTEEAAKAGAKLIVLPEMATSGSIYKDRAQINPYLDTVPGKATALIETIAKKYHVYVAVGVAELDPLSNLAYNSAVLVGPTGYIGKYRKNQLSSTDARWATRGNLGFPVFNTELGKIALLISFDGSYIQSLELPVLRGANIIAYLTAFNRLPPSEKNSRFNHSTIANIATLSGWIGSYIIASSRTDNERNPDTGLQVHYMGGASIWGPSGEHLAQAPVSLFNKIAPAITIYAQVSPGLYYNAAKQALASRRPELYQVLNLYREPINPDASIERHQINALMLQYLPFENNKKASIEKIKKMLEDAAKKVKFNFTVLPENSVVGPTAPQQLLLAAEDMQGNTVQELIKLARLYKTFIVFSMPEKDNGKYYSSAILIDDQGKIAGVYRKTHLNALEQKWATAGNDLAVFSTTLGRVALSLSDEVCIPDIAAVFAAKRADLIAVPSAWSGQYGGPVSVEPGLLTQPFAANTMTFWYNLARFAQAYTLIANYVGGQQHYKGSSGLYSLDPVEAHFPPALAADNLETAFYVSFPTIGSPNWWITQEYLNIGQRVDLNVPLTLNVKNPCFINWQMKGVENYFCWNN